MLPHCAHANAFVLPVIVLEKTFQTPDDLIWGIIMLEHPLHMAGFGDILSRGVASDRFNAVHNLSDS